jgi:hypothetical protein
MVDRPIKKADRPAKAEGEEQTTAKSAPPERKERSSARPGGKGKGRGKRDGDEERSAPPMNPAFARGPKPPKAQPEPEPVAEEAVEETGDEAAAPEETAAE